eukprot:CAMPEP_0118680370 /NCGR_PEP_ID=MMETSP0800-20121206/4327_1 /TAXON_ID=210618 ORGANISM="Striatella unipunctata, Strain CCMP2910" /NCGR_SAMPLE_ID=MMETSP0800 /ASSEMBLY_ACC=CAM_ASM_000638 /LENGTH=263 /DNA_ID=CAMNT_0006576511 /DNA_START=15 /DNA_END=803 /DNA_ORIENTATION=-
MLGSFAEYLALPRADINLTRIPKNVSFVEAASLGCRFTTAYRAVVQQGKLKKEETVAVFGCGGLGLSCIMIAAATNTTNMVGDADHVNNDFDNDAASKNKRTIIAIDVSEQALEKALQVGATHVVNARSMKNEQVRREVCKLTSGNLGADLSIDAAGFASTCENAVHCTRKRMVQVGLGNTPVVIPMGSRVVGKELEIVGSHGFRATDMPHLLQLVAEKKLNVGALIERRVTLEEGARAIQDMDHKSPLGFTVVTDFSQRPQR